MPDPVTGVIAGSSLLGASSANKAAKAQSKTADQQIALQERMFQQTREDLGGYREAGGLGLEALMYEMGLGAAPKDYGGFTATPGYDFRLQAGNDSINALAGARGGLHSGATLKALADYNQGMASDEYGNYLSRLMGLTDMGQASAANTAQASNAFAQMGSNALANKGNALAGGAAGFNNAIQDGINSGINLWGYQQGLSRQQPAGFTPTYSAWRP